MASIKLTGDTSGVITVSAPAAAGTNTLTLPAATSTVATIADVAVVSSAVTTSGANTILTFTGSGTYSG